VLGMIEINIQDPLDGREMIDVADDKGLTVTVSDSPNYFAMEICQIQFGANATQKIKDHFTKQGASGYWIWLVCGGNGGMIDEIVGAFNTRAMAEELVKDNKERFPNQSWECIEMRLQNE